MVQQRKFEYVIVDLDGTLVEESARLEAQARAVSKKFGGSHDALQKVLDAFFAANDKAAAEGGKDKDNIPLYMRWIGESLGIPVSEAESEALAQAWNEAYKESFQSPVLFEDTLPFLQGLFERGYEPILATGGRQEEKTQLMVRAGISNFFKKIFASDELGFQKQDVRFWHIALSELSVSPEKILVIGNQTNDDIWRTGELGMTTVLIKRAEVLSKNLDPGSVKPDYEVHNLQEILKFI